YALRSIRVPSTLRGIVCGVGRNCNAVSVEGDLYPCHRYVGMRPYIIGDVFNGLDREKILEYYRALCSANERVCHTCWLRNICGGDCPWHVSKEDGSIWPPHPRGCGDARRSSERAIWLYYELEKRHPEYLKRITAD
ncbi:MAG: SPASM domain-containing protein, partial [Candidatus Aquicultorales bacterium]